MTAEQQRRHGGDGDQHRQGDEVAGLVNGDHVRGQVEHVDVVHAVRDEQGDSRPDPQAPEDVADDAEAPDTAQRLAVPRLVADELDAIERARPAAGGAPDEQRRDRPEVVHLEELEGVVHVDDRVGAEDLHGHQVPAPDPHRVPQHHEQRDHDDRGEDPRDEEVLDRVRRQRHERVDLLGHPHRSQLGGQSSSISM